MMINFFSKEKTLSDIEAIRGLQTNNEAIESRFYKECLQYFTGKYHGSFKYSAGVQEPLDIFHESFIVFWTEIQSKRIHVCDNKLYRINREGKDLCMSANLKTFLMSIAKYKNNEQERENEIYVKDLPLDEGEVYNEEPSNAYKMVVDESFNRLPKHCSEILTLFYYEEKSLDEILVLRSQNTSKNGLKNAKKKCLDHLREYITKTCEKKHIKTYSHES